MKDPDIREFLIKRLTSRKSFSDNNILEEVPLDNGFVRADLVYCSNKLECFEIKSQYDSLKRLVTQGWQYGKTFDLITLVCASKHLSKATQIIPDWWGIIEVTNTGKLVTLRRPTKNPSISTQGMADILTNEESKLFLKEVTGIKSAAKLSHSKLRARIKESTTLPILRNWITTNIIHRKTHNCS